MTLITEALAASPAGGVAGYGDFPIIQAAIALLLLVIGGVAAIVAAMKTFKGGSQPPKDSGGPGVNVYMDGPIGAALDELKKISAAMQSLPGAIGTLIEVKADFSEQLMNTRHDMKAEVQRLIVEIEKDADKQAAAREQIRRDIETRLLDIERRLARQEGPGRSRS